MDIQSKKTSRHIGFKAIGFFTCIILIGIIVSLIFYIYAMRFNLETLIVSEYKNSSTFSNQAAEALHRTAWSFEEDPSNLEDVDYIYFISDGESSLSNRQGYDRGDFLQYKDSSLVYENGQLSYGENTNLDINTWMSIPDRTTIYIAFTDDYMDNQQSDWDAERDEFFPTVKLTIIASILSLALIIYLIIVAGRNPSDEKLHSNWVDRIYTEILLFLFIPIGAFWFFIVSSLFYTNVGTSLSGNQVMMLIIIGVSSAITAGLCGVLVLALARKTKDGRFFKDFLIYRFMNFLKSFFDGRRFESFPLTKSLHKRQLIFIVASFFMVLFTFLLIWSPFFILPPILEMVLIYWYVKYNNETYEEINKGFDQSLEEQMKSERMKLDLITNVSHDLKTPLTSIISYVDLLSKEEDLTDSARDYVKILGDKSDRLKNIVSDLFDLAKSTSGDINLELETLDMKRLIEQTVGDMEDEIERSGQQIKMDLIQEPVNIYTDGKKMYRVFQNVIDNALKYSLLGTRIFVELEVLNGKGIATIKNTSNYEMDFTSEEVLERFSRGDRARTTEGSGLGLSIAESFTKVCGGDFEIEIDGDVFKVIISFDIVEEEDRI